MQKLKSKTMAILIAALLTFSMTASMTLLPNASAHSPAWQIPTESFLNVAPNPIGVGQGLTVDMWLMEPPPTAANQYGDRWTGMTVLVTNPDGTTQTLGPYSSDDTGGTAVYYTPSAVGNYTFVMSFPGQTLANKNPAPPSAAGSIAVSSIGDYFEPSVSNIATVTVQQQPVGTIPNNPLPTNYWTRPINAENNNWYSISGNWVGIGGSYNSSTVYNPYSLAPTTAHILWTKPEAFGGTVGGDFGGNIAIGGETAVSAVGGESSNFYSNRQYETMFTPIILNGVLYYEQYPQSTQNPTDWVAVDLQTGQTIWTDNAANYGGGSPQQTALTSTGIVTTLASGQLLDYASPNQYGGSAYLWSTGTPAGIVSTGTTYNLFDAMTGMYILSIVNSSSVTLTADASGDLIGYWVNDANPNAPTLNEWNSTQAITTYWGQVGGSNTPWQWRTAQDAKIPFSDGIMWSVPLPATYAGNSLTQLTSTSFGAGFAIAAIQSDVIILDCMSLEGYSYQQGFMIEAGYNQNTGAQLWITNRTETPETTIGGPSSTMDGNGIFVEINKDTLTVNGYSDNTGTLVWGPVVFPNANTYDTYAMSAMVVNTTLYWFAMGGDVYAQNMLTGTFLWHYTTGTAQYNTPYGIWPIWSQGTSECIADGVIYLSEGHSYSPPLFRGAQDFALNLTDGQLVWSILGDMVDNHQAISDGILLGANGYDNQIYAFGMGPSKTTVTAPDIGVTTATPITITGTVTDISAGSQQNAVAMNFPNGLPCVSDASMSAFMEAVYEQQPMPTNVTGVPVTLTAIDPNHNFITLGTTTTDTSGNYGFSWTPPSVPGTYQITATFSGTNSYYSSSDTTYMNLQASATPAPTVAPVTGLATMSGLTYGIVAAIIVIIIIGAILAMLMLRKRP
jgi:hypothetical protein